MVIIRAMEEGDLDRVSSICKASFLKSIAGSLSEEGVATFNSIAAKEAFSDRMKQDNLMLVAEVQGRIEGIIELKQGRHIAMLFIDPEQQKKGIGRELISFALGFAKVNTVTVSASLPSVAAYKKYGFKCRGGTGESAGLVYQPMEIELDCSMT